MRPWFILVVTLMALQIGLFGAQTGIAIDVAALLIALVVLGLLAWRTGIPMRETARRAAIVLNEVAILAVLLGVLFFFGQGLWRSLQEGSIRMFGSTASIALADSPAGYWGSFAVYLALGVGILFFGGRFALGRLAALWPDSESRLPLRLAMPSFSNAALDIGVPLAAVLLLAYQAFLLWQALQNGSILNIGKGQSQMISLAESPVAFWITFAIRVAFAVAASVIPIIGVQVMLRKRRQ